MTTAQLEHPKIQTSAETMQALVFHGAGKPSIVRITTSTICGTDLHILKGDVPAVTDGRILGHEGVGIIEEVGPSVTNFHKGDRVLISCITSCGKCDRCRMQMYSHCRDGGWILGNLIDGTQAEFVRIPHADTSLYPLPAGADEEDAVMLSDILPTGFECGVLNGCVKPGDTVAIVGVGPVGLAALMTADLYSPARIICIDLDDNRLKTAQQLGATHLVNSLDGKAVEHVMELTGGEGVNVAIEAVGIPATFDICQGIIGAGGHIANIGVHGQPVVLHIEKLWDRNITLTTRLVDTAATPMLMKAVASGRLTPGTLVTHRFAMDKILEAYDTFGHAAQHNALKVVLKAEESR